MAAGSIGAFAVPTRDALLPLVAQGNLPRAVALATALQFAGQLVGIDIDNASAKVDLHRFVVSKIPASVETIAG